MGYFSALRLVFLWCCVEHVPKDCVQSSLRSFVHFWNSLGTLLVKFEMCFHQHLRLENRRKSPSACIPVLHIFLTKVCLKLLSAYINFLVFLAVLKLKSKCAQWQLKKCLHFTSGFFVVLMSNIAVNYKWSFSEGNSSFFVWFRVLLQITQTSKCLLQFCVLSASEFFVCNRCFLDLHHFWTLSD